MVGMIASFIKRGLPGRVRGALEQAELRVGDLVQGAVTRELPLPESVRHKRVLLLGASVARAWRLHLVFPRVRTLTAYQFDKSALVRRALALHPHGVILKECAAYFPPDRTRERARLVSWTATLREAGVAVALATVLPVTRAHAARVPGRAEGLWAFNDWLRALCQERAIPLLDLEEALRESPERRYLQEGVHAGDGLHLSRATYRTRLDPLIPPLLLRMFATRRVAGGAPR